MTHPAEANCKTGVERKKRGTRKLVTDALLLQNLQEILRDISYRSLESSIIALNQMVF